MNLTDVPRPVMPRISSITPAISVHIVQAVDAVFGDDAGDDDDETRRSGRRSASWSRPAPRSGSRRRWPCKCPACGVTPDDDGERHRQRQRDQSDRDSGDKVVGQIAPRIVAQANHTLGE